MYKFRDLRADEVEVRVAQVSKKDGKWCTLLLYKDARCDQNILDETVGATNWQRHHTRDNANCIVSIWDSEKQQWIEKEDTGTESSTEAQKGLASDSFKRACFNWGIGRELYTAPLIYISVQDFQGKDNYEIKEYNGKFQPKADFYVDKMEVVNKRITYLVIKNRKKSNKVVFTWGKAGADPNQMDLGLPDETPAPEVPAEPQPPKPYHRKDDVPPEEQDAKVRAFELFKAKYPQAKLPGKCFAWIFGTSKDTTNEEWEVIKDAVFRGDYTNNVATWNAQLEKEATA